MVRFKKHQFLFEELVKRDFKKKYKRTVLGMLWSLLSPLFMLGIMAFIFGNFFANDIPHYTIYLFTGLIVFNYYTESTNEGMQALINNAGIFSKINVPKYLFLFSKNISALINFTIILLIYFIFVFIDGISFSWKFLLLVYPFICLIIINLGIGLILSALFIFFRDIKYLYDIITRVIMYGSAIFYSIDKLPVETQMLFYGNPVFVVISYVRQIVLYDTIPPLWLHVILMCYTILFFGLGAYIYKKYNYKFLYYI
ncbi:ABC transporter permease [Bibersteinia trehalosi]|uniref:ABC transporter permease n=1 Tax=Bibersteinia trehalosi TaxID=47735 RepID=UPI003D27D31E